MCPRALSLLLLLGCRGYFEPSGQNTYTGPGPSWTAGDSADSADSGADSGVHADSGTDSGDTDSVENITGVVEVSAGTFQSCARFEDGHITCWGDGAGAQGVPDGVYTSVSAGYDETCALQPDGHAVCWGHVAARPEPSLALQSVHVGMEGAAGIDDGGLVHAWGQLIEDDVPTSGTWTQVRVANGYVCAISTGAVIDCWGAWVPTELRERVEDGYSERAGVGDDGYAEVAAGDNGMVCSLDVQGYASCWGDTTMGSPVIPTMQLHELSAMCECFCALDEGGSPICWGNGDQCDSHPEGPFVHLSSGWLHACGLRADGEVVCWGLDNHGQTDVPVFSRSPARAVVEVDQRT